MYLIDSHCHLDFADFDADRSAVLQRAGRLGVERFILCAVERRHWPRLWQVIEASAACYGTLGLHPYFTDRHQPADLQHLREQLVRYRQHPRLCAIGEIGLDHQLPWAQPDVQRFYFEAQLELAREFDLPVIVHVRKAHAQVLDCLKRIRPARGGILHAFNGSYEQAVEYGTLGFLLGIGGAYSWPAARKLRALLPRLPLQQLVLETDSPDMAPAFAAGQRNSPEHLPQLCRELAGVRGDITAAQLAWHTSDNLCRLLGWDRPAPESCP